MGAIRWRLRLDAMGRFQGCAIGWRVDSVAMIEALGDCALLVRCGDGIDPRTVERVHAIVRRLRASLPAGVVDIVPAYASVAVFVSPDAIAADTSLMARVETWLVASTDAAAEDSAPPRLVEIPVRYGGDAGPDLAHVAAQTGLSEREVVARHAGRDYTVAMLGFAPGFPYLLGLDAALAVPRRAQPRTRVEAGSVGMGGAQTGVYPRSGPGGWQIIGRTEIVLFDPARASPSLLQPGDRVRFVALR